MVERAELCLVPARTQSLRPLHHPLLSLRPARGTRRGLGGRSGWPPRSSRSASGPLLSGGI